MLIMALFLVLFSNHMEERLLGGKAVLRVDCRMTDQSDRLTPHDEKKSLLPHGQVIRSSLWREVCSEVLLFMECTVLYYAATTKAIWSELVFLFYFLNIEFTLHTSWSCTNTETASLKPRWRGGEGGGRRGGEGIEGRGEGRGEEGGGEGVSESDLGWHGGHPSNQDT